MYSENDTGILLAPECNAIQWLPVINQGSGKFLFDKSAITEISFRIYNGYTITASGTICIEDISSISDNSTGFKYAVNTILLGDITFTQSELHGGVVISSI